MKNGPSTGERTPRRRWVRPAVVERGRLGELTGSGGNDQIDSLSTEQSGVLIPVVIPPILSQ